MWGWVWTVLAVGGVLLLAWLAWTVVRAGWAVLREAGRAGTELSRAGEQVSAAVAAAQADRVPVGATMFEDRAVLRDRVHALRRARWARRGVRRERQALVWRTWVSSTWLERRRAARAVTRRAGSG